MKWFFPILSFLLLFTACQKPPSPLVEGNFIDPTHPLTDQQKQALFQTAQQFLQACLKGSAKPPVYPPLLEGYENPFQLRLWQGGKTSFSGRSWGGTFLKKFQNQLARSCSQLQAASDFRLQLSLAFGFRPLNEVRFQKEKRRLSRRFGLWGVLVQKDGKSRWYFPSDILENNLKFKTLFEKICGTGQSRRECVRQLEGKLYTFETWEYLSQVQAPYYQKLFRLAPLVPIEAVQPAEVLQRLNWMRGWYLNNMAANGKMTYLYRPAFNRKSKKHNNMIRQFMTTLALFRLGKFLDDPQLLQAAETNLGYNLTTFMKVEEAKKIAYIEFRKKAKLGAAAFALMSLLESKSHPDRERLIEYFTNFIVMLHQKDGSFRTFYKPEGRNDNQNFYPGEAELALMTLYESDPKKYAFILPMMKQAFLYYRNFFRQNSNPAFVPWHTMALFRYYQHRPDQEVAAFIGEMNDFLIEIQNTPQSIKTPEADTLGRFYDRKKRKYGPPHASSTAVYTEGLIDAYRLAKQLGDKERMKRYQYAIRWGLRSLFQLQYTADSAFYIPNQKAVLGALHTKVTNNNLRVDNTQHATMAFLNLQHALEIVKKAP